MGTMTIRLPDDRHKRLQRMAKARGISLNKLIEEFSTTALAQFDAEIRFRSYAKLGSAKKGLKILDKLDSAINN